MKNCFIEETSDDPLLVKDEDQTGGELASGSMPLWHMGSQVYYYLLRDYLGNITHQVNMSNTVVAEYSFDSCSVKLAFCRRSDTKSLVELIPMSEAVREGRRRNKDWTYSLAGEPELLAGRGFTGARSVSPCFGERSEHKADGRTNPGEQSDTGKWLPWFNLYNMNGRLYDPVVGRFLSPDNYAQMPDNTQNFNRYSYALNNPLKYTDPDGEFIFTLLAAIIPGAQPLLPFAVAADIGWMTDYAMQVGMNYANRQDGWTGKDIWLKQIDWFDVGMSAVVGGVTGGYSAELKAGKELGKFGSWVVKNSKLIYAGEIITTSAVDITGEGWQPVNMDDFSQRVAIGLTIYGINDVVGDYTKKWTKNPTDAVNQTSEALFKDGYYEVNGVKFSDYYYNKLWDTGRGGSSLVANEILKGATSRTPDLIKPGFFKYIFGGWEMVYNPITKEVWHIQPVK